MSDRTGDLKCEYGTLPIWKNTVENRGPVRDKSRQISYWGPIWDRFRSICNTAGQLPKHVLSTWYIFSTLWASKVGEAQCREHQTKRRFSKGQRETNARVPDGHRKVRGWGGQGTQRDQRGPTPAAFGLLVVPHCLECPHFYGRQQPLEIVRIDFTCRRHAHLKQRLAERVAVECD